jgi:hypothetical protein
MINPDEIRSKMTVPPQLKGAYLRIVKAGMTVMFSDQTSNMMMQQLHSSPDMVKNLSEGIAGLMAILFKQSKEMPQQLIVPAALELLTHAIDFVAKTKLANLTPEQVAAATQATVYAVLAKFGIQKAQADQMLEQMSQNGKGAPSQAAPVAPVSTAPVGIIQRAQQ